MFLKSEKNVKYVFSNTGGKGHKTFQDFCGGKLQSIPGADNPRCATVYFVTQLFFSIPVQSFICLLYIFKSCLCTLYILIYSAVKAASVVNEVRSFVRSWRLEVYIRGPAYLLLLFVCLAPARYPFNCFFVL